MRKHILLTALLTLGWTAIAGAQSCRYDLADSREVPVPPREDAASFMVWSYASNHSQLEWQVYPVKGRICTKPHDPDNVTSARPDFEPAADEFRGGATRFARVDDGWLVGFNQGEFGAALFWFSSDGQRHYRISEHQVVDFFPYAGGWAAIEGLGHLGLARGSIIRITRHGTGRWQARTTLTLPDAPYAVAQVPYGPTLIVLGGSLIAVEALSRWTTLIDKAPWEPLYPHSAVLTADSRTLYVGMRQYVAEFDLQTRKLRMLLPPGATRHRLSEDDERRIRAQYRR
jgi:hypothetical protein